VHNVIDGVMHVTSMLKKMGMKVDYTAEEAIFSAMHHDLGKMGDLKQPYFLDEDKEWRRERGYLYKHNSNLPFMTVQDRSLFLLQHFGIETTQNEFTAIRCHDGLFAEGNKPYFISYSTPPNLPPSNLNYVLHLGDWTATIAERDIRRRKSEELVNG